MMRKLAAAVVLLVFAACSSCAHVPPPIADFGQCLSETLSPQVAQIIAEVEAALASHNYVALLVALGKRAGFAVVDCAVHAVMGKARARVVAGDSTAILKVDRGTSWLARK